MSRSTIIRVGIRTLSVLLALVAQSCAQAVLENQPAASAKHVEIDKTTQTLRAYEGDSLVLESRVSTGRMGRRTPSGNFTAGIKLRMHYSRLYDNAPMPFSVQVNGNYFIHGFKSVPDRPASHGCIRLPLDGENPAKLFFDWVEPGTPVTITGEWNGRPKSGGNPKPASQPAAIPGRKSE